MGNNSVKTSQLTYAANIAASDVLVMVYSANNANTTPSTRIIRFDTLCANIVLPNYTPANSSANGLAGQIAFDPNYAYIWVSNNVCKRTPLSSF